uniref:Chitin-binding type-2 domain-containing protein n=1 Tax=Anopheles farauti TaxID=69004 RepID=A0A182Q0L4_9DIPT
MRRRGGATVSCASELSLPPAPAAKFQCQEEGFAVDPNDCAVFYRCVQEGDNLTAYKFRCGPGTVFSMTENVCVHPRDSEREECRETGNEIDGGGPAPEPEPAAPEPEPAAPEPEPQTMEQNEQEPAAQGNEAEPMQGGDAENSVNPEGNEPTGTEQGTQQEDKKPIVDDGVPCEEDGFVGDRSDCQVFYRCISRGDGSFEKLPFRCGNGTLVR